MHFARATPVRLAQDVDGAALNDDAEPRVEGTPWIIGRARTVYRQQRLLHHVVRAVGRNALAASDADDDGTQSRNSLS